MSPFMFSNIPLFTLIVTCYYELMVNLDDVDEIKKLDPKNVLGSTGMFVSQCRQIWELSKQITFPDSYKQIKNIVVCGMGGSSYGGRISLPLFKAELPVPIYTNDDYHLPAYVNQDTLIILSSYSGTTEETLSCAKESLERKAKIIGLTSGGQLGEFFKNNNLPALIFEPKYNPSGQPRLGTGYTVFGAISILNKLGLVVVNDDVTVILDSLEKQQEEIKNKAIEIARLIYGRIPVIFAAEFLKGNAYIMRNQSNETAKSFSAFSELPDLNHHLMEGLKNPPDKKLFVLFLSSDLYSDRMKKRVELTKDVVGKNNVLFDEYKASGSSRLAQVLNVLSFGGYLTYYLAIAYGQDPSVIPWVDYFKEQMEK